MIRQGATSSDRRTAASRTDLSQYSLPSYLRLALIAIALVPLQQAFTINIGNPLKPSELFMGGSMILWLISSKKKRAPAEFKFVIGILIVLTLSALFHLAARTPLGDFLGYTRSPTATYFSTLFIQFSSCSCGA